MGKKFLLESGCIVCCLLSTTVFSQPLRTANMSITNTQTFAKDFDQYSMHPILNQGSMFAYGTTFSTKGSRLLFEDWVKGVVVKNSGEKINGEKYFFNFDKLTNDLLVTVDKLEIIEVYRDSIQAFTFSSQGRVYAFKKVDALQQFRFVQVLASSSSNYCLYKIINTRLVLADYNTNGLTESGNPYDEYVDVNKYYITYKGQIRKVDLRFPSIKKALKENSSKVKDYYASHLLDEVNENYLTGIVDYLNQ